MNTQHKAIPADYHDYLYRFTYFLLSTIAPTIPKWITPNQITMTAFGFAMLGNGLLYFIHTPQAYLYWVGFNFIWFILDALDGMHARLSNQTSEYGAFLDHAMDNIYFLFMLTVFAFKFDLMHILYVYIIILRVTAAVTVFTAQCHTKKLYLGKFSGGLEFFLFSSAMILSYFFPNLDLTHGVHHPILQQAMILLDLQQGVFMKIALLIYFIGAPIAIFQQFRFVHTVLHKERNSCA